MKRNEVSPYVFVGLCDKVQSKIRTKVNPGVRPLLIMKAVGDTCGVTVEDIMSRTRLREFVDARQLYCYIMREKFGLSLSKIGKTINRDHATAIHSVKTHKNKCDVMREYRDLTHRAFEKISELLGES